MSSLTFFRCSPPDPADYDIETELILDFADVEVDLVQGSALSRRAQMAWRTSAYELNLVAGYLDGSSIAALGRCSVFVRDHLRSADTLRSLPGKKRHVRAREP